MAIQYSNNFEQTIPFSDVCAQLALAQNVDLTYNIPGNDTTKYTMIITYNATSNVFVRLNAAAVVPGAGVATTLPFQEYRGGCDGTKRSVSGGDVIHFITPDASAYVGIRLMQIPG